MAKSSLFGLYDAVTSLKGVKHHAGGMVPALDESLRNKSLLAIITTVMSMQGEIPAPVQAELDKLVPLFDDVKNATGMILKRTQKVSTPAGDIDVPTFGMAFELSSQANADALFKGIKASLTSTPMPNIELKEASGSALTITSKDDSGKDLFAFTLSSGNSRVSLLLGSATAETLSDGSSIADDADWKANVSDFSNEDALLTFLKGTDLVQAVKTTMSAIPALADKAELITASAASYETLKAAAWSFSFNGDRGAKQCMQYKDESDMGKLMKAMSSETATAAPVIPQLVDDSTIAGLHFSTRGIAQALAWAKSSPGIGGTEDSPAMKEVNDLISGVENMVTELNMASLGVLVQAPKFGMMPEAGVLFSAQDGDAARLEAALVKNLAWINSQLGDDQQVKTAATTTAQGKNITEIEAAGQKLYLGSVGNGAVMLAMAPSGLEAMEKQLAAPKSTLATSLPKAAPALSNKAMQSFIFVDTTPLVAMAKPFIPMLSAQAPTPEPISEEEISEVTDLLSFRFSAWDNGLVANADSYCSQTFYAFQPAKAVS
jgi:hypothetical protein